MKEKSGTTFLLKYLYENTDMDHPVDSVQLRTILKENGYASDPRSIRSQADLLVESGYDIIINAQNGTPTQYYYGTRDWDRTEAMILIDAVSSAPFLTKAKTDQLIEKLSVLPGRYYENTLKPKVCVSENIKAQNDKILYIIEMIARGIEEQRKIAFKMYNYNTTKRLIQRHGGEIYVLSPYNTIWKDDRYYVVGWSDQRNCVVSFRRDRMGMPEVLEEAAVPPPKDYRVQDYTDAITKMYGGSREQVTLRCDISLVDNVIDKFGKKVEFSNVTKETFDVTATVAVSSTFLAWLFQYVGKMTVLSPSSVRNMYADMLISAADDLMAGNIGPSKDKVWKL